MRFRVLHVTCLASNLLRPFYWLFVKIPTVRVMPEQRLHLPGYGFNGGRCFKCIDTFSHSFSTISREHRRNFQLPRQVFGHVSFNDNSPASYSELINYTNKTRYISTEDLFDAERFILPKKSSLSM